MDGMGVEELAGVVGVVARLLQPEGQMVVVVAILDKLGVSSCLISDTGSLPRIWLGRSQPETHPMVDSHW